MAAGCHSNNNNSGYGIGWITLSGTQNGVIGSSGTRVDFTSYIVNVDSVTLTGAAYGVVTAISTVEVVDFTKLKNISELWGSASIPNDTYTSASIVLDYTSANISVMVNGVPTKAKVVDSTGAAVTARTINVTFDKTHPLVVVPTLSSSSAQRLALNLDLAASNVVNTTTSPPTVTVQPILTAATSASDTKLVRVRGPLINSSVGVGTYTVFVRPFFDEVSSLGSLTIFNGANTVYSLNGSSYVGAPGITALSQTSAGTTMTAAYTTYQPSASQNAAVTAATFNSVYVIAGSTLEDFFTQGIEGDVIKRSGNTLTLRGATLQFNDGTSSYIETPDAVVLLGPGTVVTADDNTALTGLNYNSVAVGQHISARGLYSLPASGVSTLDATGSSSANTGSVRIRSTEIQGALASSASGSLVMNLQTIENWPVSNYDFTGNGAAAVTPANFVVDPGTVAIPAGLVAADPVWIDGVFTPFGTAPPDFRAFAINTESSVPATLRVDWTSAGTTAPFATLTAAGLTIDLNNANYSAGVIQVGSESIDLKSSGVMNPTIVPAPTPAATALPAVFLPLFTIGGPTATAGTTAVTAYNAFTDFVTQLPTAIVAATPALHFVATGVYNRGSSTTPSTFTASSIDVVN
jgi:sulfur transfer complex TusBCD TusB component (DsrH family)